MGKKFEKYNIKIDIERIENLNTFIFVNIIEFELKIKYFF